jgi:hypothetical protein
MGRTSGRLEGGDKERILKMGIVLWQVGCVRCSLFTVVSSTNYGGLMFSHCSYGLYSRSAKDKSVKCCVVVHILQI